MARTRTKLILLFFAMVLFGPVAAYAEATRINSHRAKLNEMRKVWGNLDVPADVPFASKPSRKSSERDSGRDEIALFIKNTNFRFFRNIGFYVPELVAILKPDNAAQPVVFDDPFTFTIHPVYGRVLLSGAVLTELMNSHTFNFKGAPLRRIIIKTEPGRLNFSGQMNRKGKWVPFVMKGPVKLEKGHVLVFTPDVVVVAGKDAGPVMKAANVTLDELLKVKAPGVNLIGSKVFLDALKLFPPPKLGFTIQTATLDTSGLELVFKTPQQSGKAEKPIEFPAPVIKADSHIMIRGGDVKFFRAMTINSNILLVNKDEGKPLDFSLYDYREQLMGGLLKFKKDGTVLAYLKSYEALERQKGF